jgi:putative transcriptional regulator
MRSTLLLEVIAVVAGLGLAPTQLLAQEPTAEAVFLVAHPSLRDLDYRQTVLIAAPVPSGGHIGVILNRPTQRLLGSLFPGHGPSKSVVDPVFYGGPFSRSALVAIVKSAASPGEGSVPLMKDLFMAFRATTIDHVIETTPNDARYYVGYVGWRPGELSREIERGLWSVLSADKGIVFRKNTDGLWEEMLRQSRQLRAGTPASSYLAHAAP